MPTDKKYYRLTYLYVLWLTKVHSAGFVLTNGKIPIVYVVNGKCMKINRKPQAALGKEF